MTSWSPRLGRSILVAFVVLTSAFSVSARAVPGGPLILDILQGRANATARLAEVAYGLPAPLLYDAALYSVTQQAVGGQVFATGFADPVLTFLVFLHSDPYAHATLTAQNPSNDVLSIDFSINVPTVRLFADDAWHVTASFNAQLEDRNGDGASVTPRVATFPNPLGPAVYRLMETSVTLGVGSLVYFGGPPVPDLGGMITLTPPAPTFDYEVASSGAALPPTDWIGPDVAWNMMSLHVAFDLSPGDRVVIQANYDISPVPEPAPALMLVLGCALLAWRLRTGRSRFRCVAVLGQIRKSERLNPPPAA